MYLLPTHAVKEITLEKIAMRLIEQKRFEYDNSILIRSQDC
jgi:hypothetical protein